MRRFKVYRPSPPQEYYESGTANPPDETQFEGVLLDNGKVIVNWCTQFRSFSIWDSLSDLEQVHGHPEYGSYWEWME